MTQQEENTQKPNDRRKGSCLCGEVTFDADVMPTVQACHCDTCQKLMAGPFIAVPCTNADFHGPISVYKSSEHAERGFCANCGSSVYCNQHKLKVHVIPFSLFENNSDFKLRAELFIEEKPAFYSFKENTKKITGREFGMMYRKN